MKSFLKIKKKKKVVQTDICCKAAAQILEDVFLMQKLPTSLSTVT